MKKLLLFMVYVLLVRTTVCFAQETEQSLQLTIRADKETYTLQENVTLEATLENKSEKELIVFWSNEQPVIFTEEAGVYIVALHIQSCDEAISIKPKESISRTVVVSLDEKMKLLEGKIGIQFLYNTQNMALDFKYKSNQELWLGSLVSNTITIRFSGEKSGFISKKKAIAIAKKYAVLKGVNVAHYKEPTATLNETENTWDVSFRMDPMPPGGFFDIIIDGTTGEVMEFWPGE